MAKPDKIEQLVAHANDCMSRYDLEAALKFYEKAVSLSPENTDLLDASSEVRFSSLFDAIPGLLSRTAVLVSPIEGWQPSSSFFVVFCSIMARQRT